MTTAPNFLKDRCPGCLYKVDSATPLGSDEQILPRPGDFSICLNCGQLNRYGEDSLMVEATPEDTELLDSEQFAEIKKAQSIIQKRGLIA